MIFNQIRYLALLGPREEPKFLNVPQESLNAPLLRFLGYLPQSMFHFVYGVGQYKVFKEHSLQAGYDLFCKHSVNPVFAAWPIRGNFVRKTDKAYVDPQ